MVEFALVLPLVVLITVYGLEIAWVTIQQQKVNQLAAVTADNAARVRATIDETDVNEIMTAVEIAGRQMKFIEHGRIILSSIQLNAAGNGQWIRWQRCQGELKFGTLRPPSKYGREGKGATDRSLQGVGKNAALRAPSGNAIMVAEIQYDYQPLISNKFYGKRTLRAETAYLVRDRTSLEITNNTSMTAANRKTCAI